MAEPDCATELLEQSFEPETVTAGFESYDHWSWKLLIESAHLLFVLVLQFGNDEFASFNFQITDGLLSCMKVNANIYLLHSASFQSHISQLNVSLTTHARRRCFITSVPPAVAGGCARVTTHPLPRGGTDCVQARRPTLIPLLDRVSTTCGSGWVRSCY